MIGLFEKIRIFRAAGLLKNEHQAQSIEKKNLDLCVILRLTIKLETPFTCLRRRRA